MSIEKNLTEVGPGFWNIRGQFKILIGIVDIGTHMSIVRLSNQKYLIIDTIPLSESIKAEIDALTGNGANIEAVIATHPFHTLAFEDFRKAYPSVPFYGTPRHLRNLPELNWVGDLEGCDARAKWEPDVQMRIPAGAEFNNPQPEKTNHFNSIFVYHPASRTIHVDDTIMYCTSPSWIMKIFGYSEGTMFFHPSMKSHGLYPTPEAPYQFKAWVEKLLVDWDFDNICTAHLGNRIGGAKQLLKQTLDEAEPTFKSLAEKNKNNAGNTDHSGPETNVKGHECG